MSKATIAASIVATMQAHKAFAKESQFALRGYVTDRTFPLNARFLVWSEYCVKKESGDSPGSNEFGIIGKMVNDREPIDYDRYAVYDWDWFLDQIQEDEDLATKYGVTVDEFKEQLIETNFGSFVMDW